MSGRTAIPPELHAPLLAWMSSNHPDGRRPTHRDAAVWLAETYGVKVSRMSVTRLVASQSERGDAMVVAALREELRDAVGPARTAVVKASRRLVQLLDGEKDMTAVAKGVTALTGALETLARLGGVAAPIALDVSTAGKALRVYLPEES